MRLAEVKRRARGARAARDSGWPMHPLHYLLYRDTLRTLLDHDLPEDARQLIEAALEAEG